MLAAWRNLTPTASWPARLPCLLVRLQAAFLDTPGIVTNKRNKLEDKMMASVQQVGLQAASGPGEVNDFAYSAIMCVVEVLRYVVMCLLALCRQ